MNKNNETKAMIKDFGSNGKPHHWTRVLVKFDDNRDGFDVKVETAYDAGFALADRGLCFEAKNMSSIAMYDFCEFCDSMIGPHGKTPIADAVRVMFS